MKITTKDNFTMNYLSFKQGKIQGENKKHFLILWNYIANLFYLVCIWMKIEELAGIKDWVL